MAQWLPTHIVPLSFGPHGMTAMGSSGSARTPLQLKPDKNLSQDMDQNPRLGFGISPKSKTVNKQATDLICDNLCHFLTQMGHYSAENTCIAVILM